MEQQLPAIGGSNDATWVIAGWSVDPSTLRISSGTDTVKLEPKVMAVLEYLAARPGQVVSREELEQAVWTGTVVGYDAISNAIIKLRKAFGDDAQHPQIIETISKSGYRLIAPVKDLSARETDDENHDGPRPVVRDTGLDEPAVTETRSASRIKIASGILLPLLLIGLVGLLWLKPWSSDIEAAVPERMAYALPDKPSIAVLPFVNNSDDPEQEYFVDGITEDLITDLSKLPEIFVVARNSVFTYKGKAVKIGRVAEELGVRYVLEGSVRRVGDDVRINAKLIDALSGGHTWAERYDGELQDVFSLQDQITQSIVKALALSLNIDTNNERFRSEVVNVTAYDHYWKGWRHFRAGSPVDYGKAVDFYEQALSVDPDFALARAALAAVYSDIYRKRWWKESLGMYEWQANDRARLALGESKKLPVALTHQVASEWYSFFDGSAVRALREAARAIALNPNDPAGHLAMAYALLKDDQPAEAEQSIRAAMRLDPHAPPEYHFRLGQIQYHLGQYEAAIESFRRAIEGNQDDDWSLLYLAASHGKMNQVDLGRQALARANALRARQGWGPVTTLVLVHPFFQWRGDLAELKEGLRAVGMPAGGEWYRLIEQSKGDEPVRVTGATTIDAAEARKLHDRGVVFIDITAIWFQEHIPGAIFLELWKGEGYRFNENALAKFAEFDQEIVVYDSGSPGNQIGRDSAMAAAIAVSRGFTNVYYFPGGLDAWKAAGYPTERP